MRLAASGLDALVGKLFRDGTCYRIGHAARWEGNDKTDGPFRRSSASGKPDSAGISCPFSWS